MIKHLLITTYDGSERYMCNQACSITKEKCVKDQSLVTCKNCLKQLKMKRPYMITKRYKVIEEV